MDLSKLATQMLMDTLGGQGGNAGEATAADALNQLIGEGQEMDLGGMLSQLQGNGLADAAASWLGDGDNASISAEQITQGLGADQVADFASKLGVSESDAAGSLAQIIPNLVNESSSGGDLLGTLGGLASKFLK